MPSVQPLCKLRSLGHRRYAYAAHRKQPGFPLCVGVPQTEVRAMTRSCEDANGSETNLILHVSSTIVSGALDLDMVLHCKWVMLFMTLDMPDEGTR